MSVTITCVSIYAHVHACTQKCLRFMYIRLLHCNLGLTHEDRWQCVIAEKQDVHMGLKLRPTPEAT